MKVNAFKCDYCEQIKVDDETVGVSPQEDAFEKYKSYPTIINPDKAIIHYCLECYEKVVLFPARSSVSRAVDERGYELKVAELAYLLRSSCVSRSAGRRNKHLTKGR